MGGYAFAGKVLEEFQRNPGQNVTLGQLRKILKFRDNDEDNARIRNAVSGLKNRNGLPIETVMRGAMWRLTTDATAADTETSGSSTFDDEPSVITVESHFTLVGKTKTGIMLRDAEGNLWSAKRM